ncbi:MAG: M56 family metallopeptidase [Verrucomicrobiota bacterium]|jgi:beta-lactamase regulating signal transducer with metallopeptidase domain
MNTLIGMERFFGWLLQTTWQAAVIAVIILLAQLLLRNRLSPAWRHGFWFLLLARLVMPTAPSSSMSVFNLAKWDRPLPAATAVALLPDKPDIGPAAAPTGARETISRPSAAVSTPSAPTIALPPAAVKPTDWMALAAAAWFAGVLVLTLRFVWLNHRFRRRLGGYTPGPDEAVKEAVKECAEELGVRQRVQVIETEEVESPAVYGFWRKSLLLPDGLREQLSRNELRHVLLHELAHIKRRDPEVNGLMAVLQVLHWFNPVLWFAFGRMRADRELATDDLALARSHQTERISYGETILKVLDRLTQRPVPPGLVGIGESKAEMKERIRAISRGGGVAGWRWVAGAAAVVIASVALTSAREEGQAKGVNLLEKYPTKLTSGDGTPERARPWQFTQRDIFQVSGFTLEVGKQLQVHAGAADLGIGHCADGAVWAVLIPREEGALTSPAASGQEDIAAVWLRFHPAQINRIFPPETVTGAGSVELEGKIRAIAGAKFRSSWHAGNNAMIPEPKDITVDIDTKEGTRRFFVVDKEAQTAEYIAAFARSAKAPRVVSMTPANGAKDVDPSTTEIVVVFDQPMADKSWSMCGGGPHFPELAGDLHYDSTRTVLTAPVKLKPGWSYEFNLNSPSYKGFRSAKGVPLEPMPVSFRTSGQATEPVDQPPKIVSITPANGAKGVDPDLAEIKVVFDRPMQDGSWSFVGREENDPHCPQITGQIHYDAARTTWTAPVKLKRGWQYGFGLNDPNYRHFKSESGLPLEPVWVTFTTAP